MTAHAAQLEAAAITAHAHALVALWPRTLEPAAHPAAITTGTIGRQPDPRRLPGGTVVHHLRRETRDTVWTLVELTTDAAGLAAWPGTDDVPGGLTLLGLHAPALAAATTGPDPALGLPHCRTHAREDHGSASGLLSCLHHRTRAWVEPPGALEFLGPCPVRVGQNTGETTAPDACGEDLRAYPGEAATCTAGHVVDAPTARAQATAAASTRLLTLSQLSTVSRRLFDRHVPTSALEQMIRDGRLPTARRLDGAHLVQVQDVAPLVLAMRATRRPRRG